MQRVLEGMKRSDAGGAGGAAGERTTREHVHMNSERDVPATESCFKLVALSASGPDVTDALVTSCPVLV